MNRIFFHNQYDKNSIDILNTLSTDIQIINVYGGDEVPKIFKISHLPYLVDKQIILTTSPPYLTSTPTVLQFECRDYQDSLLINENRLFYLDIKEITDYGLRDIGLYNIYPNNGILEFQLDCPIPKKFRIRLDAENYYPYENDIEVVDSA